jgi:hypothetical protein
VCGDQADVLETVMTDFTLHPAGARSIVATRTLYGAWHGYLFVSPCLLKGSIPADYESDTV